MTKLMRGVLQLLFVTALFHQSAIGQTHEQGFEAMMMEKWDKAIDVYSSLTKSNNTDQLAWLSLSNAWLAKGNKDKAAEVLNTGFNANPEGVYAMMINSRQLLLQNRPAEAEAQFLRALKKAKKDMAAIRQYGESYLFYVAPGDRKPNLSKAVDLFKQALEIINNKDFETLMNCGYAYREQGNGGEAARQFEYASNFKPKSPLPFYMLGTVYKAGKLNDRFVQNMESAISLDNGYTPALRAIADYYYFTRKWEQAREAYNTLLEKGTDLIIEDEMQYANTLFLVKDYQACTEMVEKIIAKDGSKNYLRRLLGYSYYENGDYAKGQSIMDEYFKMVAPEKIVASDYIYQGRLQLKAKNDTTTAISYLRKAIDKDTAEWGLYQEIGNLYYTSKDYCNAANCYGIWLDSLKSEAKAIDIYRLGVCQFYCKEDTLRYQNALLSFEKVTQVMPNAGIGWLWAGKAAARLDVDITVDTSAAAVASFGKAYPYFSKFVEIAKADTGKNKKDLITALEYTVFYHYVRKEDEKAKENIDLLLSLDPTNQTATELQNLLNASSPPAGGKG